MLDRSRADQHAVVCRHAHPKTTHAQLTASQNGASSNPSAAILVQLEVVSSREGFGDRNPCPRLKSCPVAGRLESRRVGRLQVVKDWGVRGVAGGFLLMRV